jgi:hypothetical protein
MKKYYPILLSKPGELKALSQLDLVTKNGVTPILQVLPDTSDRIEAFAADWNFDGNELYLDFSLMNPFVRATASNLITHLRLHGVDVVPVVQENSNPRYISLITDLINSNEIDKVCVRLSNNSGGFMDINTTVSSLLTNLGVNRNQSSILLDFGFVGITNYNTIATVASTIINSITNRNDYENIIIASGSFPDNLGALNPAGRVYRLTRYEWNIWLTLQTLPGINNTIKYSDYGTKHPFYSEANFQGSCSIKYTAISDFVVYRGEISGNHPDGNGQYITFSGQLIGSADYSGAGFSWGDGRISFFAGQIMNDPRRKTGNAGSWVEISQNHHITFLYSIL